MSPVCRESCSVSVLAPNILGSSQVACRVSGTHAKNNHRQKQRASPLGRKSPAYHGSAHFVSILGSGSAGGLGEAASPCPYFLTTESLPLLRTVWPYEKRQ